MNHHSKNQLKAMTRISYNPQVADVCEIIDREYTALVLKSAGLPNQGPIFLRAIDKYHLAPYEARNVVEALRSIWRWQVGKYVITKPVDAEERR